MFSERELVLVLQESTSKLVAEAAAQSPLREIIISLGGTIQPIFSEAVKSVPAESPAARSAMDTEVSRFFKVSAPDANLEKIASELLVRGEVETLYIKPPAEPATLLNEMLPQAVAPSATPDFASRQGYLDPAPAGVDARYSWTQSGGRGDGVNIIDIEGAWRDTHEDLQAHWNGIVGGTATPDIGWRNHGTAVVGAFGGDENGMGITGISPNADVSAISIFGGIGSAGAISAAASKLSAGDIILLELHRPGPRFNFANRPDQRGYIAIEWWPDDYLAIKLAANRGIIVVEAGGNGAENLDDGLYETPATGFPAGWLNSFRRANRDSGAIFVGAGAPPPGTHGANHGPDRSRLAFSNWAAAFDAQGWGREVTTTGYGDLQGGPNEDQWYTDQFSGTSSASPIIVGVIACMQGIRKAAGRPVLSPAEVRDLLRRFGSTQQASPASPLNQRIGNRPDLRALIQEIV